MTQLLLKYELVALVDRLLLEQGRLDPLELLIAGDLLSYADYEAWRLGLAPHLEGVLRVPANAASDLLAQASRYAGGQGLVAESLVHLAWGAAPRMLSIGQHTQLAQGCAHAYVRPANRIQLDLFQDNQFQILEDAVRAALAGRRIDAAHTALTRLMALDPKHAKLPRYLHLIQAVEDLPSRAAAERLPELEALEPEAQALLGHRARDLLAPLWVTLAEDLARHPFDPTAPRLHASTAWARAGRFAQVRQTLEADPDWRRRPQHLIDHAEACRRTGDLAAARRDWAMLCWEHPAEAARTLSAKDLPDPRLVQLWRQFNDTDLDLTTALFPAWLLVVDPGTAAAVPPALAPANPAGDTYRALHPLVTGDDAGIRQRKVLAARSPELLRLYLAGIENKVSR
ncbi:hypothetical protein [uncultured Lamprocystis sp.]|uniref:hypothetical protein n=1 Tax=uncultured Lamprocystis sp. TaxID=543132 RepID=UPI0025FC8771|nr:hypothetical protein [uncultured Lamprocystis sp.]